MRHVSSMLLLVMIVAVVGPARAQMPADRQAAILARALAYDRALKERSGATVDIAVIWPVADAGAAIRAHQHTAGFVGLGDLKIAGLPLRVHEVPFGTVEQLVGVLKLKQVDAVGDKPTIFVNTTAATREGASFAANLLRVAVVITAGVP